MFQAKAVFVHLGDMSAHPCVPIHRHNAPGWETNAQAYVAIFAVPNFYFHVTTAYDILRSCGVPLDKMDFLGGMQ